jgi:hypothetical protein
MASQNRTNASDRGKAVVDIPTVPTIGTATAGDESVSVAFTAASVGGPATTFTALSNPGSITGSGSSSPVTVSGLTVGTAYTFTVRGNNATGSSEYSSASNSATPFINAAFESIATATGTGTSGTVTFSSIPSTYKHLQIRINGRSDYAGTNVQLAMRLNSDTGTNYSTHNIVGIGSSTGTTTGSANTNYIEAGQFAGSTLLASSYGVSVIDILDYENTNKFKTTRSLSGFEGNGSGQIIFSSGSWRSTSAVTTISLLAGAGNWTTLSSFALYGIKG